VRLSGEKALFGFADDLFDVEKQDLTQVHDNLRRIETECSVHKSEDLIGVLLNSPKSPLHVSKP
jgi:hypothetical protein